MTDQNVMKDMADQIDEMVANRVVGVKHHQSSGYEVFELNIQILTQIGQLESFIKILGKFGAYQLTRNPITVTYSIPRKWKNPYK